VVVVGVPPPPVAVPIDPAAGVPDPVGVFLMVPALVKVPVKKILKLPVFMVTPLLIVMLVHTISLVNVYMLDEGAIPRIVVVPSKVTAPSLPSPNNPDNSVAQATPSDCDESARRTCRSVPTPNLAGVAEAENPIRSPLVVPMDLAI
jgi:hypothetical protein